MRPYDDEEDGVAAAITKFVIAAVIIVGFITLGLLYSAPAKSHILACADRAELTEGLKETAKERPVWLGLKSATVGGVPVQLYVELWMGEGTWTLAIGAQGNDRMCVTMNGQDSVLSPRVAPPIGREAGEQEP